eukprot:gnl/TRDRNA2_/TRDRNA2_166738_c1_seq3.p1 gnl/TRDRNA2_/TRDRNA2_166738_c1~~gnl/TRDRNA2_/TRDRNA2_166738_c1_seq3.p1  ORF type:complete len:115 (+),score=8.97 gnl/TRDRNA2_/TRDRNA2_166738_c1_seq3:38-382(+)
MRLELCAELCARLVHLGLRKTYKRYRLCTEPSTCSGAYTLAQLHLSAMLMRCVAAQPFAQLHMSYSRPLHEEQKKKVEDHVGSFGHGAPGGPPDQAYADLCLIVMPRVVHDLCA